MHTTASPISPYPTVSRVRRRLRYFPPLARALQLRVRTVLVLPSRSSIDRSTDRLARSRLSSRHLLWLASPVDNAAWLPNIVRPSPKSIVCSLMRCRRRHRRLSSIDFSLLPATPLFRSLPDGVVELMVHLPSSV